MEIRPVDWGGLGGVEALDPSLPQITPVYESLTGGLKKAGYKERVDLFGAPYDFRLAADGLEQVLSSCHISMCSERNFPSFVSTLLARCRYLTQQWKCTAIRMQCWSVDRLASFRT